MTFSEISHPMIIALREEAKRLQIANRSLEDIVIHVMKRGCCYLALEGIIEIVDYHHFTTMQSNDGGAVDEEEENNDDEDGVDEDDDEEKGNENDGAKDEGDADSRDLFVAFCDEHYPKRPMLNDYIHFMKYHADSESIESMKKRLYFECESATSCCAMRRHYRDRRDDDKDRVETNWCVDRMDSVHFTVYHLTEIGLRFSKNVEQTLATEESVESEQKVDRSEKERVRREAERKRKVFRADRLDGTKNGKFKIPVQKKEKFGGMFIEGAVWKFVDTVILRVEIFAI